MRKQLFIGAIASLLMASCSNELESPMNQTNGDVSPLQINVVANPISKALVTGSNFTGTAQIGVKLVDGSGSTYDGKTYNNISYGTTNGTTWTINPSKSILLSATPGMAYAYYPYTDNASLDFTAIPISSAANPDEQTDYMYGNVASGLKNSNPTASFTMSHAMSIVNFTIAKGSYTGTGSITSVKMSGNTASNTGTMNAEAGTVTATNAGYEFTSTNSLTLGNSSTGKFIVVPSGTSSKLDFKVVMDGQTYTASTADVTLASGQVYKYTLTMNSTGLSVSTVTVTPWGSEQDKGSLDTELLGPWDIAKSTDGVYAIDNDGNPVDYATANAAESGSYKGVAFVIKGKAYQVAKVNATGYNSSSDVYWHKSGYSDISGLANFTKADGTNISGYLAGTSTPQLSRDPASWTAGALSDFNGEENTEIIIAAQTTEGVVQDYTIGKAVMDFRSGSNNEGHNDWFIPSCGELAYMFLKKTELNTLLGKVSGSTFASSYYWSSSECGSNGAWSVRFSAGGVDSNVKNDYNNVRLVRAI